MANTKKEEKVVKKVGTKAAAKKTTATAKKATTASTKKVEKKETKVTKAAPKKAVVKSEPKKTVEKKTTVKKEGAKRGRPPKKKVNIIEEIHKTLVLGPEKVEEIKAQAAVTEEAPVEVAKKDKKESGEVYTYLGTELPKGDTPEDKKDRRAIYVKEATLFAIIIPVLDLFAMLFIDFYPCYPITNNVPVNYCLTLLIDFVLIFGLAFLIDFIHGELAVKKNK